MKRTFDFLLSVLAGILLLVLPVIVVIDVRLTSKGPTLSWSNHIGQNNIFFKMPNFRSMRVGTPALAKHLLAVPQSQLTPIGSFLRKVVNISGPIFGAFCWVICAWWCGARLCSKSVIWWRCARSGYKCFLPAYAFA